MNNYWWLNINPRILRFKDFDNGDIFAYSSVNEDGTMRKVQSNFLEAKKGETVFIYESVPVGQVIGMCVIERELENNYIYLKKIESFTEYIKRSLFEQNRELVNLEAFRNQEGIFFKVTQSEYNSLINIIRELNPTKTLMQYEDYSKEKFLNEVYFNEYEYDELRELIKERKNVILQGAPGVGKTFIAKRMAYSILGKKDSGKILNVQFHPNYSCDEFIEGFRPDDIGIYKYRQGCFKEFCNVARNDRENKYFLLIDEINRGDVIKIFGDTFMLLEPDKRGKENYVELPSSKERFYIPKNLYIIGTMNVADNEQSMADYAVRRRFCFFHIQTIFDNPKFKAEYEKIPLMARVAEKIKEINNSVDNSKEIGHCYFCNVKDEKEFIRTVKYELLPLLEEYFKNDKIKLEKIKTELYEIIEKKVL